MSDAADYRKLGLPVIDTTGKSPADVAAEIAERLLMAIHASFSARPTSATYRSAATKAWTVPDRRGVSLTPVRP